MLSGHIKVDFHGVLVVWLGFLDHLKVIMFFTVGGFWCGGDDPLLGGARLLVRRGAVFSVCGSLGRGVQLVLASHMEDNSCQSSSEAVPLSGL